MIPDQEEISQNNIDTAEEKNKSTGHESTRYQSSTKRIAKNTLMLYFRQMLIMLVSLYTVRVVLNTLGAEDYGIYNVVAGVVTMFSFLSGAMATASQRYFAFEMGKGNEEGLQKIFSVTMTIYVLLALIIVLLAETVGLWFVNTKLVIPTERTVAARWIYQFAILSFMVTLLTTPYMASIIAHENMNVYACVSIVEAALKLGIVFVLQALPYDKLIVYGGLLLLVACINTGLYRGYCKKHYSECRFRLVWDKVLFKEMVSYSGWNLIGSISWVLRTQGVNILLNIFFNPVINASRTIAVQVSSAVSSFSQNFSSALRPPIIKTYAASKKKEMVVLLYKSSKYLFFLMLVITLPLCSEIHFIFSLWLKNIPPYSEIFTILILIDCIFEASSYPVQSAAQATGRIALYQCCVSGILCFNVPISFLWLNHNNESAVSVFVISILLTCVAFFIRLFLFRRLVPEFSIKQFLLKVLLPAVLVYFISSVFTFVFKYVVLRSANEFYCCLRILLNIFISVLTIYFIGMSKKERNAIFAVIKNKLGKIKYD